MDRSLILKKRPRIISWLTAIGFAWALRGLLLILTPEAKHVGAWYPAILGLIISFKFISYVGVRHMKKWGVEMLVIVICCDTCLGVMVEKLLIVNYVIALISLLVFAFYYRRMDSNL